MRLVIQRVLTARVEGAAPDSCARSPCSVGLTRRRRRTTESAGAVDGKAVGEIGRGLCVLVGLHRDDTSDDIDYAYDHATSTQQVDFVPG